MGLWYNIRQYFFWRGGGNKVRNRPIFFYRPVTYVTGIFKNKIGQNQRQRHNLQRQRNKASTQFQTARGACIRRPKKKIHRGKGRKVRRYRRGAVSNKLVPAAIARRSNCRNRLSIFWREARGGHVQQAMFQYLHREMEQGSEQNPTAEKAASSAMSDRQDTRTWNSKKRNPIRRKTPIEAAKNKTRADNMN